MLLSILRLSYNETFHSECHSAVYCLYQAALLKTYLKQDFSKYFNSWFGRSSVAVRQGISIKLRNLSTSVYSEQSTFINWDINLDYVNRKNLHNMTHLDKSCPIVSHISLQFHSSEEIVVLKSQSLRKYS